MTDAEMARAAKMRLTELAQRALQMHRTRKTRDYIIKVHNRWNTELASHDFTYEPVQGSVQEAFEALQHTTQRIIEERGHDPDSILHWLDMYPLDGDDRVFGVKTAPYGLKIARNRQNPPKTAKTPPESRKRLWGLDFVRQRL